MIVHNDTNYHSVSSPCTSCTPLKQFFLILQYVQLKAEFKDIMRIRMPTDIPESQIGRAVQFKRELQKILHAASAAAHVIEGRVEQVKGNAGRREEEIFWLQMKKRVNRW